jgi:hypothetical protein
MTIREMTSPPEVTSPREAVSLERHPSEREESPGGAQVVQLYPNAGSFRAADGRTGEDRTGEDRPGDVGPTGQDGMATAEYAIATLGAVAFAGLLVVILRSDEVRGFLLNIIRSALSLP